MNINCYLFIFCSLVIIYEMSLTLGHQKFINNTRKCSCWERWTLSLDSINFIFFKNLVHKRPLAHFPHITHVKKQTKINRQSLIYWRSDKQFSTWWYHKYCQHEVWLNNSFFLIMLFILSSHSYILFDFHKATHMTLNNI